MDNITYKHDIVEHGGKLTHIVKAKRGAEIIAKQRGHTYYEAVRRLARDVERLEDFDTRNNL